MWFGIELGEAVIQSRPSHVLFPYFVQSEQRNPLPPEIEEGLERRGHNVKAGDYYSVVQAIYRDRNGNIFAKSDPRKGGRPSGY